MILASQKFVFDKRGLGYKTSKNEKYFKNYFVKESTSESSSTICNFCGRGGHISSICCNDPYQIIQVFLTSLTKFDQPIVGGAKLNISRINNFGLSKTPFRRPRRYEFTDRLNVKI